MDKDSVRAYYAQFGEREWLRLTNPDDGAIEFAVTQRLLSAHLPAAGRVLDIGGGPGRYTLWLVQHGYSVVLADLSPELLRLARVKVAEAGVAERVEEIVEADACDLSRWSDASFDAVLCLGPFYHLPDVAQRQRAAAELVRVLRPGGQAFVAFIPRYAFVRRTLALADERHRLLQPAWVDQLLNEGIFENDVTGRFTHGYGADPAEIIPFFSRYGLLPVTLLTVDGILAGMQGMVAGLAETDPGMYQCALDLHIRTATDPGILNTSTHLLYVGSKEVVSPV